MGVSGGVITSGVPAPLNTVMLEQRKSGSNVVRDWREKSYEEYNILKKYESECSRLHAFDILDKLLNPSYVVYQYFQSFVNK